MAPIRVLVEALAIGFGLGSAAIVVTRAVPSSYAATAPHLALLDLGAGLGLIAAGLLVARLGHPSRVGVLAVVVGVVWLCPDLVGWAEGPALARSVAMVAVPFLLPLLLHLATAASPVGSAGRFTRLLLGIGYAGAAAISLARAFFRDPFRDVYCWNNCTVNVFLLWSVPGLVPVLTTVGGSSPSRSPQPRSRLPYAVWSWRRPGYDGMHSRCWSRWGSPRRPRPRTRSLSGSLPPRIRGLPCSRRCSSPGRRRWRRSWPASSGRCSSGGEPG